jgi:hypothetical protein
MFPARGFIEERKLEETAHNDDILDDPMIPARTAFVLTGIAGSGIAESFD